MVCFLCVCARAERGTARVCEPTPLLLLLLLVCAAAVVFVVFAVVFDVAAVVGWVLVSLLPSSLSLSKPIHPCIPQLLLHTSGCLLLMLLCLSAKRDHLDTAFFDTAARGGGSGGRVDSDRSGASVGVGRRRCAGNI